MRRIVRLSLCLALGACGGVSTSHEPPAVDRSLQGVAVDGTTMRRLMGEGAIDQPLLPQPGNIWADVLPPAQPAQPVATSASVHSGRHLAGAPGSSAVSTSSVATSSATPTAGTPTEAVPRRAVRSPAIALPVATAAPPIGSVLLATGRPSSLPAAAKVAPAAPRPVVQLAAARTAQDAEAEWRRLRQHAASLTDGHAPALSEAEVNGQHVWRLRAVGFADVAEASAFCTGIRAVKANCWVVPSASP